MGPTGEKGEPGRNASAALDGESGNPGGGGSVFVIPLNLGTGDQSYARQANFREILRQHLSVPAIFLEKSVAYINTISAVVKILPYNALPYLITDKSKENSMSLGKIEERKRFEVYEGSEVQPALLAMTAWLATEDPKENLDPKAIWVCKAHVEDPVQWVEPDQE
ncbi:unnamed protein product [Protopolystoma xenopodis]|uniref:Fibrillar collagen NC1 domain-containing protein n=1 Tax=Protopolystoma xenopodis TaxID=117903 RepID=A0A448XF18_9PLAT|nr:unnamed protein product [Protopolystoma xenopodis]